LPQRLAVSEVSSSDPVESRGNLRLRSGIRQLGQPIVEDILPASADVVAEFDHKSIVTYKSQRRNSFVSGLALWLGAQSPPFAPWGF
jgi:hypothetical protein